MFISTSQLSEQQLQDLNELQSSCREKDGNLPNIYTHILKKPRNLPSTILCYENNQLIGFLSAFFFYDEAVEISLLVAPRIRRKGLAKKLIHLILPLIQNYHYSTLIFSSPSKLNDSWLTARGFRYLHSEYHMKRASLGPILHDYPSFSIRNMIENDIASLIHLDEICFEKKPYESQERFNILLKDNSYHILVLLKDNQPIGKSHIRWDEEGVTLSDIAILPTLQGKGLGTALIAHSINYALNKGESNISLDVEANNERALNIYTRLGFITKNVSDYWRIAINDLF